MHSQGSLAYRFCPQETSIVCFSRGPRSPLGNIKNIYRYFWQRYTGFSRFWYLSCAIARPLAAVKIVNTYPASRDFSCPHVFRGGTREISKKVYKQCKFCEEQKELTNEFKAKVIFISLFKMFPKFFNKNIEFFHRVTKKRHSRHPPPPHPYPQTYNWRFLWVKTICEVSLSWSTSLLAVYKSNVVCPTNWSGSKHEVRWTISTEYVLSMFLISAFFSLTML